MKTKAKTIIKSLLAKQKVRQLLLIAQSIPAWVIIRALGLFDDDWYRRQYAGGKTEQYRSRTTLMHYLLVGRKKGLSPSPFFIPEYYDSTRWNISILDPLVKYTLRKNTWKSPTSVFFDGGVFNASTSKVLPPLSVYLKAWRADKNIRIYFDKKISQKDDYRWLDVEARVFETVAQRSEQYEKNQIAEPTAVFDTKLEQQTIKKYLQNKLKNETVSIVMPAWNRQELIKEAIDSVQRQTYQNWELLIVDDGSTDNTVEVIRQYARGDARIKLFTPPHGGVCKARNYALDHANGKWIAFLDSDNTWLPDFLQTSIGALVEHSKQASYSAIKMDKRGSVRYRVTQPDPALLRAGNYIDLNSLVVSSKVLKKVGFFDEDLRRMVDYDLVIRISKVADFMYIPIIGVHYSDHDDVDRISTTESVNWDGVVKNNNFIEWNKLAKGRKKNRVSVVIPVRGNISFIIRCILSSIRNTHGNVEFIVVDASSTSAVNIIMAQLQLLDSRIKYYREPAARDVVLASNYGFAKSTSEKVVILSQYTMPEPGWLDPLFETLNKRTIHGPLQLQPNRTIRSAGVEYYGRNALPVNLLENHPLSDTNDLPDSYQVDGISGGCVAISASLFAKLKGFNPLYVGGFETADLCHRARKILPEVEIKLKKESRIVNADGGRGWYNKAQELYISNWAGKKEYQLSTIWHRAGFKLNGYKPLIPELGEKSAVVPKLIARPKKGKYRWAIKISAPADERRFAWGDLYYAEALAAALERQGQRVAIDYHDHHDRVTSYLDDIIFDLRGLDTTKPHEGKLNIMWVISHPEKVTPAMVNSFDLVFAAGTRWAEYMTQRSNKVVEFLPQCTDPAVFHPMKKNPEFSNKILFVGNSRNIKRPIVADAIAADLDVAVYGNGWDDLIDAKYVKGTFIPNNQLASAYSSASVVLNDHWADMQHWGFISNRIFDVLASGGKVVSDSIEGIDETLGQLATLKTYTSPQELKVMCKTLSSVHSRSEIKKVVNYIHKNHSFDSRAKVIITRVNEIMNA